MRYVRARRRVSSVGGRKNLPIVLGSLPSSVATSGTNLIGQTPTILFAINHHLSSDSD